MWWYATGSSLIKEKVNADKNHTIEVACIDLSEYIFNLQKRINILKIDVEGAEYHIIKHLIETKAIEQVDNVFFEDHSERIDSGSVEFFKNKEFVLNEMDKQSARFSNWM